MIINRHVIFTLCPKYQMGKKNNKDNRGIKHEKQKQKKKKKKKKKKERISPILTDECKALLPCVYMIDDKNR